MVDGVKVTVKDELCENVVDVRKVIGRVMAVVFVFEDLMRLICGYVSESV